MESAVPQDFLARFANVFMLGRRRAARAFGEYLSHTHPENLNGSAHLLCETLVDPDPELPSDTIGPNNNNHLHPCSNTTKGCEDNPESNVVKPPLGLVQPPPPCITISTKPSRLSLERSFSAEEDQQKCVECTLQPARVYTITTQRGMLMSSGRGSKESLELDVLKEKSGSRGVGSRGGLIQPSTSPSSTSSSPTQYHHASSGRGTSDHHSNHRHGHHHGASGTNAPSSSGGSSGLSGSSSSNQQQQQQSLSVAGSHSHHGSHHGHHHHLSQPPLQTSVSAHNIRSWGEGGKGEAECSGLACDSCSTAPSRSQGSLDLESASREAEDTNWFPKENMFSFQTATTTMQAISNFRKHLRMVGSRRIKAQSGDLQASCGTLDEGGVDDNLDWEEEREMERLACEGDDFVPPKIMGGPGHLYLLKNKVATFAKVEKEEDMSQFWRRLSRFMSKINPEPNLIHIMGCYVLGNPNGEKLFQKLKNLMRPYSVEFESPLELSAQGKEMIELYFDFRLYRLWKTRQHSKLLDYEDFL
ncbi:NMDA receptor synaptonuclear signaling and neuronal migration factor [Larimichthys crocea]|uniref:Uncharacterized protein n=1 Tax=Larimichthys crocea TaxID=215358 RepID=A0ACD3QNQ6_LARCR|nr:NMDA receptor synaptonuclear signaling and neuronal migration factor [Larimichthys crocea]